MLPEKDRPRCTSVRRATSLGPVCQSQGKGEAESRQETLCTLSFLSNLPCIMESPLNTTNKSQFVSVFACTSSTPTCCTRSLKTRR